MDNSNASNFPIAPVISAILGGVTTYLFERYKNRNIILTHTISFQSLGSEINDPYWGVISISHQGRNIRHLSFIEITITNITRTDATGPLNLVLWVDKNSKILGNRGVYDTGNAIKLEESYYDIYTQTLQDLDADEQARAENPALLMSKELSDRIEYCLTNKTMSLPIFNRKSFVKVFLLVENLEGLTPKVSVTIPHKGVKLIPESDNSNEENIKKIAVGLLSLLLNISGIVWLYSRFTGRGDIITWTIAVGVATYVLSYGAYYLFMYLKKSLR